MKRLLRKLWGVIWPVHPPYSQCCTERLRSIGPNELLSMGKARGFTVDQTIMLTIFRGVLYRCPGCRRIWEAPRI